MRTSSNFGLLFGRSFHWENGLWTLAGLKADYPDLDGGHWLLHPTLWKFPC